MIGFKVVYESPEHRFFSVCACDDLEKEYIIERYSEPLPEMREKGFYLTVFKTYDAANIYATHYGDHLSILLVYYNQPSSGQPRPQKSPVIGGTNNRKSHYWSVTLKDIERKRIEGYRWPEETDFAALLFPLAVLRKE